ncbi:isochorismatase hydrolase [Cavenderia fasciculata]|uniref:Isochorismatase hydrolase n=1 Tax=Cavenderia fasciculata TaxID=261658 RepID=F4PZ67_CACFS|nr:isochorismatase hydrolase [Cavenderia fasciculata]EGG19096.1 isochorismatase hydrolase [Cavenderia fasciculata]|eukprot:XP_004366729.1 isochorismatase hydrolase [Cavenderia fasciculata]
MSTALIIIDVQNDYFKGGNWTLYNQEGALENVKKVLASFREKKSDGLHHVVHVQHVAPAGFPFFVEGTEGVKIHADVAPIDGEKLIVKRQINSYLGTDLEAHLKEKKVEKLVIVGSMTHMCIDSATRASADLGFKDITVLGDACASRDLESPLDKSIIPAQQVHNAYLSALAFAFAKVIPTSTFLQ